MYFSYVVAVEGLSQLKDIDNLPAEIRRMAALAINDAARKGRTAGAREMRRQVNFPSRYLTGKDGRLKVSRLANRDRLEAAITGRFRPTSLARFSTGSPGKRGGVTVSVKPGAATYMRKAFLVRLRSGSELSDTRSNLGLAVRLKAGEKIRNKKVMAKRMSAGKKNDLYLLYGPSVDQVFRTVSSDISPDVADELEKTFLRLMEL